VPQGPRLWHSKSSGIFKELNLVQAKSDYCVYFDIKRSMYLVVWVDDIFRFYPKVARPYAAELWAGLQKRMDLGDAEDIDDCLGCNIIRDRPNKITHMTQGKNVHKLLDTLNMGDCNPAETPMVANSKLTKRDCPPADQAAVMGAEQSWYRSTIASMIYFANWTRPDLSYAVSKLCRYMQNPGREHIIALKRLIRYLKRTADYGLKLDFSKRSVKTGVYGFYDASHADCIDTFKSTLAYIFYLAGCPISWHSKLHSLVTTSTNHSEYCAAAKASREAKWLDSLFNELGFSHLVRPIEMFSDSKGAIAMTYNPVQRAATKHVDLADHYARELVDLGLTTVTYINTKDMDADLLTKALGNADFLRHGAKMVHEIKL
jgi:hypothetical protein